MICDFNNPQCEEKATKVLRLITIPESRIQGSLIYKKIVACEEHGIHLCTDSQFKYENLPSTKPEDVSDEQLFQERNRHDLNKR